LDAYLLLVVDAIEEATGKTFNKTGLSATSYQLSATGEKKPIADSR
jgi:hypothetical protein